MKRHVLTLILFTSASLMAFGQSASPSDKREDARAAQAKQAAHSDAIDMKQDRATMQKDLANGNKTGAEQARQDLVQDRHQATKDKQQIQKQKAERRQDQRQARMTPKAAPHRR